jgi:hypothetical protein
MAKEPYRIKSCNFYIDNDKIGVAESGDYAITGNDESHITAEGWSASDGTPTTELSLNTVTPVDGKTDSLVDALLNKKYVVAQVGLVDGRIHRVTMRCTEVRYTTDNKTGSLKGAFKFMGGKPERT